MEAVDPASEPDVADLKHAMMNWFVTEVLTSANLASDAGVLVPGGDALFVPDGKQTYGVLKP